MISNSAILTLVAAISGFALAGGVSLRARRSVAHWSFVAGMLVLGVESAFACLGLNDLKTDPNRVIYWEGWRLIASAFLPGIWLTFSLCYARGNSREFFLRWQWPLLAAFLIPLGMVFIYGDGFVMERQMNTDAGLVRTISLTAPGVILNLILLITSVLVLMNLEWTLRASVGTMRWRIKFLVVGLGILFAARSYTSVQSLLSQHRMDPGWDVVNAGSLVLAFPLIMRSLLRAGHFDVNVYPSHSVIHNSLILMLVGVYLLIVGVLAKAAEWMGGDASFTFKAFILLVGLVLLTLVMMSERTRLYTKRFVSRHFQRPMYDYRTVWRKFTECTASRMDQKELCRATVTLVADIFQVLSVSVWLVDEQKASLTFAASTSFSDTKGAEHQVCGPEAHDVIQAFQRSPEPINIDASKEKWAMGLKKCYADNFQEGGSRICVPMMVGGELLGVLTLGDRVGGMAFLHQDLDLLKCVGDQIAASLRNLQLSGKLFQVKEMEAFQAMSTFFVHDLKNTASTLSLMLKNLPIHFNDPAFREDALRGVQKTVTHINSLISRLSMLRHGLELRLTEADLNEVVTKTLAAQKGALTVQIVEEFHPLPRLRLDPEQLLKVITNLVLNANDAVSKQGQIRIGTNRLNGWAVLAVTDNGCGMSPEFMSNSLFRPFKTTKKAGLGIGMFQSKMIVEAHGGRIEVESEAGKGTTFRVLLPLQNK